MKLILENNDEVLFEGKGEWKEEGQDLVINIQKDTFHFHMEKHGENIYIETKDAVGLKAQFGQENKAEITTPFGHFDGEAKMLEFNESPDKIQMAYWVLDPEHIIRLTLLKEEA